MEIKFVFPDTSEIFFTEFPVNQLKTQNPEHQTQNSFSPLPVSKNYIFTF
jgi:hypothetical protein